MATVITDFDDLIAAWPAPAPLKDEEGNLFVTLSCRGEYIEAKWTGYITAGDVVTAAKVYLALLQKNPIPRLLNDKTDAVGDWTEANDWLEFEWLPKVAQAGLCALAHVHSSNVFSRLSAQDLYLRIVPNLSMDNFDNAEAARIWLLSCPC